MGYVHPQWVAIVDAGSRGAGSRRAAAVFMVLVVAVVSFLLGGFFGVPVAVGLLAGIVGASIHAGGVLKGWNRHLAANWSQWQRFSEDGGQPEDVAARQGLPRLDEGRLLQLILAVLLLLVLVALPFLPLWATGAWSLLAGLLAGIHVATTWRREGWVRELGRTLQEMLGAGELQEDAHVWSTASADESS